MFIFKKYTPLLSALMINIFNCFKVQAAAKELASAFSDNSFGIFIDTSINFGGGSFDKLVYKVEHSSEFDFTGGINYVVPLRNDKYCLLFGCSYNYEPVNFRFDGQLGGTKTTIDEQYNLHYIGISPLGVLIRSEEICDTNFSVFVKCAITGKILASSTLVSSKGREEKFVKDFNRVSLELSASIGVEYIIGEETTLGLGIGIARDFFNKIREHDALEKDSKIIYESTKMIVCNFYAFF